MHTKYLPIIFLVFTATVSSFPLSYADRMINYETVSDVKEESLISTISDVSNYPQIFPDNVRFVKLLDNRTNLVEMNAGIDGIFFDTEAIYKQSPDGKYVIEVISGDLKGTTMTTELKKTWGFDGEVEKGTITDISLDLKTSGFLSWVLGFVPDSSLSFALENGFDRFVEYAKSV
jgi:hypothetical protein